MWPLLDKPVNICSVEDEVDDADVAVEVGGAAHLVSAVGSLEAEVDTLKRLINALTNPLAADQSQ